MSTLFPPTLAGDWSVDEVKALVEFVLFRTDPEKWLSHKRDEFWESAARFVQRQSYAYIFVLIVIK